MTTSRRTQMSRWELAMTPVELLRTMIVGKTSTERADAMCLLTEHQGLERGVVFVKGQLQMLHPDATKEQRIEVAIKCLLSDMNRFMSRELVVMLRELKPPSPCQPELFPIDAATWASLVLNKVPTQLKENKTKHQSIEARVADAIEIVDRSGGLLSMRLKGQSSLLWQSGDKGLMEVRRQEMILFISKIIANIMEDHPKQESVVLSDDQARCCARDAVGNQCHKQSRYVIGDGPLACCAEHLTLIRGNVKTVREVAS